MSKEHTHTQNTKHKLINQENVPFFVDRIELDIGLDLVVPLVDTLVELVYNQGNLVELDKFDSHFDNHPHNRHRRVEVLVEKLELVALVVLADMLDILADTMAHRMVNMMVAKTVHRLVMEQVEPVELLALIELVEVEAVVLVLA